MQKNKSVILLILLMSVILISYIVSIRVDQKYNEIKENKAIKKQIKGTRDNSDTISRKMVIKEITRGLNVPWSIAFTSKNRILVTERSGNIRIIENNKLKPEALIKIDDVISEDEEGLMGMALDPYYLENKFVYVCYAYNDRNLLRVKIVRIKDIGTKAIRDKELLSDIPAAKFHAGCRLAFGPDNKLYATTGDAGNKNLPQDINSLGGKILRLNTDGSVPLDNPIKDSYVYSYGHRNPQGLAWDKFGNLYSSEHGPSGFDGKNGGDEINKIIKGENYGWPLVSHEDILEGTYKPLVTYTPALAPASLLIYKGTLWKEFRGNLFFGGLRGEGLYRVMDINGSYETTKLKIGDFGRIRDVVESPDGEIWFSTSNTDGRGSMREGDDKIYRITPE